MPAGVYRKRPHRRPARATRRGQAAVAAGGTLVAAVLSVIVHHYRQQGVA